MTAVFWSSHFSYIFIWMWTKWDEIKKKQPTKHPNVIQEQERFIICEIQLPMVFGVFSSFDTRQNILLKITAFTICTHYHVFKYYGLIYFIKYYLIFDRWSINFSSLELSGPMIYFAYTVVKFVFYSILLL